jgi:hypothetical protein
MAHRPSFSFLNRNATGLQLNNNELFLAKEKV